MLHHARLLLSLLLLVVPQFSFGLAAPKWNSLLEGIGIITFGGSTSLIPNQNRARLKERLLVECRRRPESSSRATTIQEIVNELAPLSPITATASSPLLQKKWNLEWTTEKEINFFINQGISSTGSIYQVIQGNNTLINQIPFVRGGGLGVTGELSVADANSRRTDFCFTEACLDLGRWGKFNIPPIGKGWFDTVYLDENLRVDVNSRDDMLICTLSTEQ
jgi:hypothetical protein